MNLLFSVFAVSLSIAGETASTRSKNTVIEIQPRQGLPSHLPWLHNGGVRKIMLGYHALDGCTRCCKQILGVRRLHPQCDRKAFLASMASK